MESRGCIHRKPNSAGWGSPDEPTRAIFHCSVACPRHGQVPLGHITSLVCALRTWNPPWIDCRVTLDKSVYAGLRSRREGSRTRRVKPGHGRRSASGGQFAEDHASDSRRLASELAARGQRTTSEVSAEVEELLAQLRRRSQDLEAASRDVVQHQLDSFDLATNHVLAALAYRLFGGREKQRSR